MAVQLPKHRFTVDEYYRMAEAGILNEDSRVELIDGEIVDMAPIGPEHAGSVDTSTHTFVRRYGDVAHVRIQNPIRLDRHHEPQPDLALLRHRDQPYSKAHPGPGDVLLVVEVSDSTLRADLDIKLPMYARFGIPEVWVTDLQHDLVLIHREPTPTGYRLVQTARRGERIAPLAFPDLDVDVSELLGAR